MLKVFPVFDKYHQILTLSVGQVQTTRAKRLVDLKHIQTVIVLSLQAFRFTSTFKRFLGSLRQRLVITIDACLKLVGHSLL